MMETYNCTSIEPVTKKTFRVTRQTIHLKATDYHIFIRIRASVSGGNRCTMEKAYCYSRPPPVWHFYIGSNRLIFICTIDYWKDYQINVYGL